MNIFECERYAKDNGFDSVQFDATFPAGVRRCKWLDAYMGCVMVEGLDGFMMTRDLAESFPSLGCTIVETEER